MNEIAKDKAKPDNTEEQRKKMDIVLDYQIEKAAERFETPEKTQATIFKLQKRKQKIMARLKEQLRQIDNPFEKEAVPEGANRVKYQDGKLVCTTAKGEQEITLGELLTDIEWGLNYYLDPNTVPRLIRKKYFIEQAKHEIMDLLDRQIMTNESQRESVDELKKEGYIKMIAQENQEQSGKYAERMVKNLLKKIAIDQDLDIEISDADAYQDMELKIDFIIKRKMAARGVNVETNDEDRIGIQFTSTDAPEIVHKKERQIRQAKKKLGREEKIQDIALVSIPLRQIQAMVQDWKRDKLPGGPDKLWNTATRAEIFGKVMKNFLAGEEIDQYVAKIQAKQLRAAA